MDYLKLNLEYCGLTCTTQHTQCINITYPSIQDTVPIQRSFPGSLILMWAECRVSVWRQLPLPSPLQRRSVESHVLVLVTALSHLSQGTAEAFVWNPTRPFTAKNDVARSFPFSFNYFLFDGRPAYLFICYAHVGCWSDNLSKHEAIHIILRHTQQENTIKSIPHTKERKYRITMFRVRRARRRTRGRGACAWRRPWTRTRWPRCSRPATTTATSAAPPTPGPQTRRNSCFHEKMVAVIHRDLARRFYQDFS